MQPGALIEDRFEIVAHIASGGMGEVHRAIDRHGGEAVAIKMLRHDATDAERFIREARLLAGLRHPGISRYITHGVASDGRLFIAMEWLEGEDLARRLQRAPLSVEEALTVALKAAEILALTHARGVVHRDIKPANLFLRERDVARLVVLDFGIARSAGVGVVGPTRTGTPLGTPGYMAPEQIRGEREIDARADVFALGCVLFECVTGRGAFEGETPIARLMKPLLVDAPRARELDPSVPAALDDLVARMLARNPGGRPRDAAEVLSALGALSSNRADSAVAASSITPRERRPLCVLAVRRPADAAMDEAFLCSVRDAIARHDGRLMSSPQGAVVTLAEAGSAGDHAARTARCAMSLRERVPEVVLSLSLRSTEDALSEVLGELTGRATRPPGASSGARDEPRSIRLDEVTADLLEADFEVRREGDELHLLGERDVFEPARRVLGRATRCVGRDRELLLLDAELAGCVDEPASRAALIVGPAGIGKSRLVREWLQRVRGRGEVATVLIARGDPVRAGVPFGLVASAIRRLVDARDGEPIDVRRQKLGARLSKHLSGGSATRVLEFLGELVGIPVSDTPGVELRAARRDAQLMGDQMRKALEDWLAAECAVGLVLWVFEDLHWGDLPSVRCVDAALRNLPDRSLFVLATGRAEVLERFPGLWSAHRGNVIELRGLGPRFCERLAREVFGEGAPAEQVASVVAHAGGNPLFLEELIRAGAGGYARSLPATLLAMIEMSLEALTPDTRRALRAASVFGQVFWRGAVAALLQDDTHGAAARVDDMIARELVVERSSSRFHGEREFSFRHAPVRDAAYAMLTDDDRALGHRLAASWLEAAGDLDAVVLADHYERGGELERARRWHHTGAVRALEGNDLDACLSQVERAIACGTEGAELGALLLVRAEALRWRGDTHGASAAAAGAGALLPRWSASWCAAMTELCNALYRLGEHDRLAELDAELDDAKVDASARGPLAVAWIQRAKALFHGGRSDRAREIVTRVEGLLAEDASVDAVVASRLFQVRAYQALDGGRLEQQLAEMLSAHAALQRIGDMRNACMQQANLGAVFLNLGVLEEADRWLREALVLAQRLGLLSVVPGTLQELGRVQLALGRFEEALRLAREAVESFTRQGYLPMAAVARSYLAEALLAAGRTDEAAREGLAASEAHGASASTRGFALSIVARARVVEGRAEEALALASNARSILSGANVTRWSEQDPRFAMAEALHALGRVGDARREIIEAKNFVLERAGEIAEAELREAFLSRVPENVRVLGLAAKLR